MSKLCYGCFSDIPEECNYCPKCGFKETENRTVYPQALPMGTVLNAQYVIGKVLGQGGFGITYLAQDYETKQLVAVKEFFPGANAVRSSSVEVTPLSGEKGEPYAYGMECFVNEALILAEFTGNENIANVECCFKENGTAYYVMEYVSGKSFEKLIHDRFEQNGGMSWDEVMDIMDPVLSALEAVHSKGIVHRDIAPDNIFIQKDGAVKLLDFGAARYSMSDATHSLDVVLKHGFAPKEQYSRRGKQGPYTDVYAAAATIYYAITGHKPPDAIERTDRDELAYPSAMRLPYPISSRQEDVLLKALSVDAYDRYQTAGEFQRDLRSATNTPDKLYTKALSSMEQASSAPSVDEQVALYREAIRQLQAIIDMPNVRSLAAECERRVQYCEDAIQDSIDAAIHVAKEKAETNPYKEEAEKDYRDAMDIVGKTAQLTGDQEKKAKCEQIYRTCEENMSQHLIVKEMKKARKLMSEILPDKEKLAAYQQAIELLETVKIRTNSAEVQNQCDEDIRICKEGIRNIDAKKRKLWIVAAACVAAVTVIAILIALLMQKPKSQLSSTPTAGTAVAAATADASASVTEQQPSLEATVTNHNTALHVVLKNADAYSDIKFAVWSDNNGQDDLKYYIPERNGDGLLCNVKLAKDGDLGRYFVRASGIKSSEEAVIATATVDVNSIDFTNLRATVSEDDATMKIQMEKINGYDNIRFAVWGEKDGENDLAWYSAKLVNDKWEYTVNLQDHNETGTYNIHAYGDISGEAEKLDAIVIQVNNVKKPEPKEPVLTASVSEKDATIQIRMDKVSGYDNIRFAVWGEKDDQNDLAWYSAKLVNDKWEYTVNLQDHNETGTYNIHAYGNKNGKAEILGGVEIQVKSVKPEPTPIVLNAAVSEKDATIQIQLEKVNGYNNIRFAVWGEKDDQNDLAWYNAELVNDKWVYTVNLQDHNETGIYNIHAYGNKNGKAEFLTGVKVQVNHIITPELTATVSANMYDLVIDITQAGNFDEIKVAVWSDNGGQDDLKWYPAEHISGGNWQCIVGLPDHGDLGVYHIHAYGATKNSKERLLVGTSVEVAQILPLKVIAKIATAGHTMDLSIACPKNYTDVKFAVWGAKNGQNDLRWYNAELQNDGTWRARVNFADHGESGNYLIDAYCKVPGAGEAVRVATAEAAYLEVLK